MITILIGKPGSGKSYHVVRYLVNYLETLSSKSRIDRVIYTNVSLNLSAFQDYFDRRKIDIKVDRVVRLLKETDLRLNPELVKPDEIKTVKRGYRTYQEISPTSKCFFWNRFEDNALIIIDEIQKYIGSVKEYGESEEQSLVEYFSLHRHKKHDWIFVTQALTSLSVVVRRVSERVIQVFNSKSLTLPFPLSIPVADIYTLLRGFGVQNQVYRVREGYLEGTYRVIYEGPVEVVRMTRDFFALYQTHTLLNDKDSPAMVADSELPFDLGRGAWHRAVRWFLFKHGFRLTLLSMAFGTIVYLCVSRINGNSLSSLEKKKPIASKTSKNPLSLVFGNKKNEKNPIESDSFSIQSRSIDPINLTVIDDIVYTADSDFTVGDIAPWNGRRIASVSALDGIEYESASFSYIRDFQFLRACRFGLSNSPPFRSVGVFETNDNAAVGDFD